MFLSKKGSYFIKLKEKDSFCLCDIKNNSKRDKISCDFIQLETRQVFSTDFRK